MVEQHNLKTAIWSEVPTFLSWAYIASCCHVILNWSNDSFTMTTLFFLSQSAELVWLFLPPAPSRLKTASTICLLKNHNVSASHSLVSNGNGVVTIKIVITLRTLLLLMPLFLQCENYAFVGHFLVFTSWLAFGELHFTNNHFTYFHATICILIENWTDLWIKWLRT